MININEWLTISGIFTMDFKFECKQINIKHEEDILTVSEIKSEQRVSYKLLCFMLTHSYYDGRGRNECKSLISFNTGIGSWIAQIGSCSFH